MGSLLLPGALIVYIIGIFLAIIGTVYRSEGGRRASIVVYSAAWLLQLAAIVRQGMITARFPINNVAEYLLVLGWIVLTLYLIVWIRWRVHVAGLVLPPLAAMAGFLALQLLPEPAPALDTPHHGWFLFHTTVSTVGMAFLGLAFAMSLIYLVQDWALKSKRTLRALERLPSLERCDRIGFHALSLGFLLLTLGIGTGIVMNSSFLQRLLVFDAKYAFPLLAWFVFAAVLLSRTMFGFRGRKSALLTIAGFALGLLTVVGMTL